eukprot:SAG11_NODE_21774_length_419_cov_0.643750_1_plen_55_part_00
MPFVISLTENFDARPGYLLMALSEYLGDLDGLKQTSLRAYLGKRWSCRSIWPEC